MRFRDKLLVWSVVVIWSAVGGGLLVNKAYVERGVIVVERVVYKENPLVEQAEQYRPLMEKLLNGRMASAPVEIRLEQRTPVVMSVPHPRRRPTVHESPDHSRKIEDVIALAEAGL